MIKKYFIFLMVFALCTLFFSESKGEDMDAVDASLAEKIQQFKEGSGKNIPEETRRIMREAMEKFLKKGIENNSLKVGDKIPLFELPNAVGETVKIADLLEKGSVVISFYRGHWCPYCNLELGALQQALPAIKEKGASLVAISPELPDHSLSAKEKQNLSFEVLSDAGNKVAGDFGIVFELQEELRPIYAQFGIDLPAFNGDTSFTLPIPATYIVDRTGTIKHAFVDPDYTKRLEPAVIISVLDQINN